jgi:hypothetical protein
MSGSVPFARRIRGTTRTKLCSLGLVLVALAACSGDGDKKSESSSSTLRPGLTVLPPSSTSTSSTDTSATPSTSTVAAGTVSAACAEAMKAFQEVIRSGGSEDQERVASNATLTSCKSGAEWLAAVVPYTGAGEDHIVAGGESASTVLSDLCRQTDSPKPVCQAR